MTFETPAPLASFTGCAKYRDVVFVWISTIPAILFFPVFKQIQDFFQTADLQRLRVPCSRQSRFHQLICSLARRPFQIPQHDTIPITWNEVPVESFRIVVRIHHFLFHLGG